MSSSTLSIRRELRRTGARVTHRIEHAQQEFRQDILSFLRTSSLARLLTTPSVYSVGIPLVLIDLWATLYQWTCFPIYRIARVRRRPYFAIDRHRLAYLNGIEKANCMYCSYANGVLAYVREIAARTEQYWCPIKHARPVRGAHARYRAFFEYRDAAAYRRGLPAARRVLQHLPPGCRREAAHQR